MKAGETLGRNRMVMGNRIAYRLWSNLDFRFSRVGTDCERILGQPGHDLSSGLRESGSRWGAVCPIHILERQAHKCGWATEVQLRWDL